MLDLTGDQLVVVADCDPDRPDYGGAGYGERDRDAWRGVTDGIPALLDALRDTAGHLREVVRFIWCVRADRQIEEMHGDPAWAYRQFEDLWRALADSGDLIAWHPHLWRWSARHRCWYQETEDEAWIEDCMRTGHEALSEAVGRPVEISRMGWEFHNNVTMRIAGELGIRLDISAVPGRVREAAADRGSVKHGQLDWQGAPSEAYRPSEVDYRRPPRDGEGELGITELPRTVMRSSSWALVRWGWRSLRAIGRREWSGVPRVSSIGAYVHAPPVTAPPRAFSPLVRSWRRRAASGERCGPFVTTFHPDELVAGDSAGYGLENITMNLQSVTDAAAAALLLPGFSAGAVETGLRTDAPAEAMRG